MISQTGMIPVEKRDLMGGIPMAKPGSYRFRRNQALRPDSLFWRRLLPQLLRPFAQDSFSGGFKVDVRDMGDKYPAGGGPARRQARPIIDRR
jgi:hypothetical protein